MSKKQKRLSINDLKLYIDAERISVINDKGSVFLITVKKIEKDILTGLNTRGQKMELPLQQISEIWAEIKVDV